MSGPAWLRSMFLVAMMGLPGGCKGLAQAAPREPGTRTGATPKVVESVFDSGYRTNWEYHGWADQEPRTTGPEKLRMGNYGGWILNNYRLTGRFGGVVFRYKAPVAWGEFLELWVDPETINAPPLRLGPQHRKDLADGWSEVYVPMSDLNPTLAPFKRLRIRAFVPIPSPGIVEFDHVGLTAVDPRAVATVDARPGLPVSFTVDCTAETTPISPYIYGIALSVMDEEGSDDQWKLNPTIRRWGGNAMTRYNWEVGNVRNTAADWCYENVSMGSMNWSLFLTRNQSKGVQSAVTLPTIGWVAKDSSSVGFPISVYGPQEQEDDGRGAGNGVGKNGKPLAPGPPTRTSVPAPPEFIGRWVKAVKKLDQQKKARLAHMYFLDNEPTLWDENHRDVHPEPLGYDELWERTKNYGSAVRKEDPEVLIAGPAEWGWTGYHYSAMDRVSGWSRATDRRAHGNLPLVEWYLQQAAAHEKKTGERLLDVLDLHFYPQGNGVAAGPGETDKETSALRIRSTRALWDPTYTDESWIKEPINLIPRMRDWVQRNYPGRKLSIGEYNFGAERHMSGGLALAEALGRFGQQGLYSAFYWTYPRSGIPAFWAFRAYRNFDGKGATFESQSMPTEAPPNASAFAARSADRRRATVILLNFSPSDPLEASVTLKGCPAPERQRLFTFSGEPDGFAEQKVEAGKPHRLRPYSINVLELGWPKEDAKP